MTRVVKNFIFAFNKERTCGQLVLEFLSICKALVVDE